MPVRGEFVQGVCIIFHEILACALGGVVPESELRQHINAQPPRRVQRFAIDARCAEFHQLNSFQIVAGAHQSSQVGKMFTHCGNQRTIDCGSVNGDNQ